MALGEAPLLQEITYNFHFLPLVPLELNSPVKHILIGLPEKWKEKYKAGPHFVT